MNLPSTHSLLKKYGIRPQKRLGQNFLVEGPTMVKIVEALHAHHDDTVLEIGCGMGVMTMLLATKCRHIVAVDADQTAIDIARTEFGDRRDIEWVHGDILKTAISSFAQHGRLLIIGNIPYNISSPIFFHLLEHRAHIKYAVLMIQKEVAERIVAPPGGKDYGALSIMLQSYAKCEKLFNVAPTNFIPQPEVMSSVIKLDFTDSPKEDIPGLRDVVRAAFQKRRKTIKNALSTFDNIETILADLGIDPQRRSETLSIEEFQGLAQKITVSPTRE